jgi:putative hydrolase of HD superfamily
LEPIVPKSKEGFLELARRVASLKRVPRTGWLDRGIDPALAESVADHSFGVAMLAWLLAVERNAQGAPLDPTRVLCLALAHDLAEATTGDETPYDAAEIPGQHEPDARRAFLDQRHVRDKARSGAKRAREDAAMSELIEALSPGAAATLRSTWEELRAGASEEARFLKQVDRLETFLQSLHYLRDVPELPVASFRGEVLETIEDPLLAALRDAALRNTDGNDSAAG